GLSTGPRAELPSSFAARARAQSGTRRHRCESRTPRFAPHAREARRGCAARARHPDTRFSGLCLARAWCPSTAFVFQAAVSPALALQDPDHLDAEVHRT